MPSSTVVTLAGRSVFAVVLLGGSAVRLRVLAQEWATLGLAEGQTVPFECAGRPREDVLIGAVSPADAGSTVVTLTRPIVSRRRKAVA